MLRVLVASDLLNKTMRLICLWCCLIGGVLSQDDGYYAPQTFRQNVVGTRAALLEPAHRPWDSMMRIPNRLESYQRGLFTPARNDVVPQGSIAEPWRPAAPVNEIWGGPGPLRSPGPISPPGPISGPGPIMPKFTDTWKPSQQMSKEQQAAILHHKQALTSEGAFRFEYASDNGLAAGEVIEPDGSRVGAYQYKDPNGQLVKLKYRAGKDGFQILEGSHLPKSPEPVAPPTQDQHYVKAYEQQRQQYDLQQQFNQERPQQQYRQNDNQGYEGQQKAAGGQNYQTWRPGMEDDGQYRENEVEDTQNRGPHSFGGGYSFSFQG